MPTKAGGARTNTRRMKLLRSEFFAEGKRLDVDPATRTFADCWICKERIDYDAAPGTTDASHNLDHYKSVYEFPELQEDRDNFRHSHRSCNTERGVGAPSAGLGNVMPDWW